MEILNKKDNLLVFKTDMSDSLANAIRRYIHQIPVLAIDEIEMIKNDSALYDEVVAHRLGLIPLKTEKINEKTQGQLKLSCKKPGMVHSEELKGSIEVVHKNIPITYLSKDQEMQLNATMKLGTGSEHVKFSPGLMFFREIRDVIAKKSLLENVRAACPDCNIKEKGDKIIITDDQAKEVFDVCEGICSSDGNETEVKIKDGLVVTIESFGQIGVNDIFKKSIDILKKDLTEISKKIK